jgi:septum formation protein
MSSSSVLYFGSQSKFRREIFNEYLQEPLSSKYKVEFVSADIDEKAIRHDDPREMVKLIARGKREEIIKKLGGLSVLKEQRAIIFTTDQVAVTKEGVVREKPEDEVQAREFLRSYSKSYISTFTAYLMFDCVSEKEFSLVEPTKTHFNEFDDEVITGWLARGDCQKACGGFAVGHMMEHVALIEGGKLAVEGLTPETFMKLLKDVEEDRK